MHLIPKPILLLLSGLLALVSITGCGTSEPPIATPDPVAPDEIVVQVTESVNQPDPLAVALGHPTVTLYGDGRLEFFDRARTGQADAMVVYSHVQLDGPQMARFVEAALRASLNPGRDDDRIADASSFRLRIGAEVVRISASTARSLEADEVLDAAVLANARPVEFDEFLVIGGDRSGAGIGDLTSFPADLGAWTDASVRSFEPVQCLRMAGDEATSLLGKLDGVSPYGARWLVDGWPYHIVLRPVFAGESGCEVLAEL